MLLLFQVSHPRSPFLRQYFTVPIENWIHTSSDWIRVVWSYFETTENRQKKKKEDHAGTEKKERTVSVMFVPFTKGGVLARRLRDAEEELARQTGIKI